MPNALLDAPSPYLRQHAHNPVDWHPWSDAALQLAVDQDKPIFLSIGYATCYWCHVMERQCFEHDGIARLMNTHFINIKVDREQRPDLDALYMTATQLTTGSGGWPMSVFLTPGRKPFFCATYLPPEPMHGRSSFPQVLTALADAWNTQRDRVVEQADYLAAAVTEHQALPDPEDDTEPLTLDTVASAVNALLQMHDDQDGGFGGAPKFPQASNLLLLLAYHDSPKPTFTERGSIHRALSITLDRMARGGLYDHLAGGFHRYAVDAIWLVPHFEKMLYDQGQLLQVYAEYLRQFPNDPLAPRCRRVLRETSAYLIREMTDDTGAFWSAQDAEVDGQEGLNYVWTPDEFRDLLSPEDADLALKHFGLDRGPNFQDPHHPDSKPTNVLFLPHPDGQLANQLNLTQDAFDQRIARITQTLLAHRQTRKQPITDDKVLTAWNGMAIKGLIAAGTVLNEPRFLDAAARAEAAIMKHLDSPETGLLRGMLNGLPDRHTPAFLEDHAHYNAASVALDVAGLGIGVDGMKSNLWVIIPKFENPSGGFKDAVDAKDLFVTPASLDDGATPSGTSAMLHAYLDFIESGTVQGRWVRKHVDRHFHALALSLKQHAAAMPHLAHALLRRLQLRSPLDFTRPDQASATFLPDLQCIRLIIPNGYHLDTFDLHSTPPDVFAQPLPRSPLEDTLDLPIKPTDQPVTLTLHLCTKDRCLPPQTITINPQ